MKLKKKPGRTYSPYEEENAFTHLNKRHGREETTWKNSTVTDLKLIVRGLGTGLKWH
jgi:hypothetical protein